jgi:anti-sigma regulatory factor (Ser/Thr protein kinase)
MNGPQAAGYGQQAQVTGIPDRREGGHLVIIGGWRGPASRVVDARPACAGEIRHWIASAAAGHQDCPADPDDAALVAAKPFSNAVRHGPPGGQILTGYCLWRGGVRIVVCDAGGPGIPALAPEGGVLASSGRGLRIVAALAAQWDTFRLPAARAVWCDLGQPLRVPSADAWAWLRQALAEHPLAPPPAATAAGAVSIAAAR